MTVHNAGQEIASNGSISTARRIFTAVALAGALATPMVTASSSAQAAESCGVPATRDIAVTKTVYQVGKELGVNDTVMLAGFEAGWVESHMNNLPCGDRDSIGVFQQRPSQGWGTEAQIMNVRYAAAAFFKPAITVNKNHPSYSAGQVAQAVQRSAFPDRYDQNATKAKSLIAEVAGSGSDTTALKPLFETASSTGWRSLGVKDSKGVAVQAQQVSAVTRADGSRLVFYLVNGQVLLWPAGGDPMWVPGQSGVSQMSALQVGSATFLYTVRGGKLYEAHSGDGWASRPVYTSGVHQVADRVATIVRADGTRIVFVVAGGNVVELAGTATAGWVAYGVPNHFKGDVKDVAVVRNANGLVLYALRTQGWITAAGEGSWSPMTVYSGQSPILASALSVIGNADGSAILYTVNNGYVYEAGSNANWNNLRVGTLSGQSSVSAVAVGTTKYIYSK